MLSEKETKRISKFLSFILRHHPEMADITLDKNGWANVDELIQNLPTKGFDITHEMLDHVVATNSKQRFAYNNDKTKIRASQGHSIEVDLELKAAVPPPFLYHGTAEKHISSILLNGIEKRERQYVHLSVDVQTAVAVGGRHGKPKVLVIAAEQMNNDGFIFYISENKVWLTEHVPAKYLQQSEENA
ncbi:MAG: RNA 2'-phosphotransferase [Chitinophagaceae bacterium]